MEPKIKPEFYRKKVGNTYEFIGVEKDFQNRTQIAQVLRLTINKLDFRLQSFCKANDDTLTVKQHPTE